MDHHAEDAAPLHHGRQFAHQRRDALARFAVHGEADFNIANDDGAAGAEVCGRGARDITMAIGVDDSFIRALPGYIKRHLDAGLPLHRIVNGRGQLLAALPQQARMLAAEGVPSDGAVDLDRFLWQG